MCGIAGVVALCDDLSPPEIDQLTRMAGALRHRGPDEFGVYRDRRAGLAHARLSIIDLSAGQQPLCNETGTLWIVFNGEIFNYVELRKELEASGHRFRTKSDTEVIVHAYEQWGDDAFTRFNGQWAIALWDANAKSLVLARDPFGVRPLYITEHGGRLYFGSEVKAIFAADPTIPRRFDPNGFDELLTFWSPLAPRTVFQGIEELEPGTARTYAGGRIVRRSQCWHPQYPVDPSSPPTQTLGEAVAQVREALDAATRLRMLRADVPVGSYVSGGIDSSLVAALGLRAKGAKFATFSLRFDDAEYDETRYQRLMSQHLGSDHHEVLVTRADIARVFPDVILHTERPVLRTAPAPLFLLSRLVHEAGIKVVLTGEGADEMFAGYDLFREAKVRRFWARQPASTSRPRLLERLYPYLERSPVTKQAMTRRFFGQGLDRAMAPGFGHELRWRSTSALKRLLAEDFHVAPETSGIDAWIPTDFARWSPLAQDQYLEIRTLLSGYLLSSQGDRMLMANSVEGRFPFLDRQVASVAESLPPSYKLRGLDEKYVLKMAAAGLVPEEILARKKQPYRAPDALSFAEPTADWIEEVASASAIEDAGVFSPTAGRQLLDKCRARAAAGQFSNADNMGVVGILSTQLLYHHFIRRPLPDPPPVPVKTLVDRLSVAVHA